MATHLIIQASLTLRSSPSRRALSLLVMSSPQWIISTTSVSARLSGSRLSIGWHKTMSQSSAWEIIQSLARRLLTTLPLSRTVFSTVVRCGQQFPRISGTVSFSWSVRRWFLFFNLK